jgi:cytoskeletal protein CcmA (bactofilin family)
MRLVRILRWFLLVPALLALGPASALAADLRNGQTVTIPSGTTITDDVYAGAGTVTVDGNVDGSVIATGGTVSVTGSVSRDLMAAGGTVTASGAVDGSMRLAGGTLTVTGPVGQDLVAAGGTMTVGPDATVGRDLAATAGTITVDGGVNRNVIVNADTLVLRGPVTGDVRAQVAHLKLENGAKVGGNLTYASANPAEIASGATVAGTTRHDPAPAGTQKTAAEQAFDIFVGWLRYVVGLFALGLLMILPFRGFTLEASNAIRRSPWTSLGLGVALAVLVPMAAALVFAIGLFMGGWPLGLAAVALLAMALAVGYVLAAFLLGRLGLGVIVRAGVHPLWALLAGIVVLTLVGMIPIFGGLVSLLAAILGLGALVLTGYSAGRGLTPMAMAPETSQSATVHEAPMPA